MDYFIGIDIGSTSAKTIVMDQDRKVLHHLLQPTGWSSADTARSIGDSLKSQGVDPWEDLCVATGYGRISVPYADRRITEISCHGRGACHIHDTQNLTVIDIGGQDTKIIRVDEGVVSDFNMNDKCSAGTGRFLEVMANTLGVTLDELFQLAQSGGGTSISSMCTVFAESEVISLIGRGEAKENIAFGIVDSIVRKVASQAARYMSQPGIVCLTGGLCDAEYVRQSLSALLKVPVQSVPLGRYAGAIGAALYACTEGSREVSR